MFENEWREVFFAHKPVTKLTHVATKRNRKRQKKKSEKLGKVIIKPKDRSQRLNLPFCYVAI